MNKSSSVSSLFLLFYSFLLFPITMMFFMFNENIMLEWTIFKLNSCSMTFAILLDPISLSFSNIVCLISGCVMLFSSSYMSHDPFLHRFTCLVMLFVISMNLLVFIPSLPALLLGWDGLGIVSFVLVIYYQNTKSLGAGMITVLMNRIGDVMILISISILVLQGHWLIFLMWDFYLMNLVALTMVIAGMTKSAQVPFSSWLPAAMAAPTPVSALVHSSTLVTAGVFILIRFFPFLNQFKLFKPALLFISVLTMLMAGIGANYENDLKKIIALSTLSQLGVMMMSLSLGMPYLALFHLYTHALFKALLFLCAGMIIHNMGNTQDIRNMGLLFSQMPLTITCMNIANLSLCGAPFLSGFYSKDLILEMSLNSSGSFLMTGFIFLATAMTAAYSMRLSLCSLWGSMKMSSHHAKIDKDLYVNWSIIVLSLCTLIAGLLLQTHFLPLSSIIFVLPFLFKMMTILSICLGLVMMFIYWEDSYNAPFYLNNKTKFFFSTMWFLASISSQPMTKFALVMGTNLTKSIDFGWMEILGGQGAFISTSNLSKMNQKLQMKSLNFFIVSMLLAILSMMLYMN
uniref:NADH-ubiquinone oxidoreductase chain 5 n=1 Tax=Pygmaeconus traillii TaxID=1917173 RepID=A0A1L3N1Y7_9COND|nr:NADH dehydrogenase subunit 5 [Pygmaeconus traillii]